MGRQILTFFIIFGALFFLMRGCQKPPGAPAALAVERLAPEEGKEGQVELVDSEHGVAVTLARDGTIVRATDRSGPVFERVNRARRPLHLNERRSGGTQAIPADGWRAEKIDRGYAFLHESDGYVIRREVTLADDGRGLRCTILATGVPEPVTGFQMTAIAGVDLGGGEEAPEPFVFHRIGGEARATVRSWTTVVQDQEAKRHRAQGQLKEQEESISFDYEHRVPLRADQTLARLGVLGAGRLVAMEPDARVGAFNSIAYRLDRDLGVSREIETWLDLPADASGYEGTFVVRWAPRAEAGTIEPQLDELSAGREEKTVTLENGTLRLALTDRGAAISTMVLKKFVEEAGAEPVEENWIPMIREAVRPGQRALTMLLQDSDRFGVNPADATWQIAERTAASVTFRLAIEGGWVFEKRIAIPDEEGRYDLDVTVRATRPESATDERFKFVLIGPSGSYIADTKRGVAFTTGAQGFRLERSGGEDDTIEHAEVQEGETLDRGYGGETGHLLKGIGVRGAFFVSVLRTPERGDPGASQIVRAEIRTLRMERAIEYLDGSSYEIGMQGRISAQSTFGDDRTAEAKYLLYCGPNEIERLRPYELDESVDFGFFSSIGRGLMWLMKSLHDLFGSLGLSVVFMTLIVRALLLPVSYKSQLSVQRYSKRMQKLKPVLEELQKKYEKNRQKLNQERMRVMKEHKVGFPLGCLMMFVQIPIWIALFGALRVEFALRHEPFLWAADLSMPDRLFGLPFWPHWFNLLPILMLVLWVLQQKTSPQAQSDDPQVAAQMKMVKFMPYVFFFMLYTYASALSVYMCISSAWGIAEGKLVRRAIAKHGD